MRIPIVTLECFRKSLPCIFEKQTEAIAPRWKSRFQQIRGRQDEIFYMTQLIKYEIKNIYDAL